MGVHGSYNIPTVGDDGFWTLSPSVIKEVIMKCDRCKKKCEELMSFNITYFPYSHLLNKQQDFCEKCFNIEDEKLNNKISKLKIKKD